MLAFYDLGFAAFVQSPNNRTVVTSFAFKRGDSATFDLRFCQDGIVVELPGSPTGKLQFKSAGDYGGEDPIVSDDGWTKAGTGTSTVYSFAPDFNTIALNNALVDGTITGTVANQTARYALSSPALNSIYRQTDNGTYWKVINASQTGNAAGWELAPQKESVSLIAEVEWITSGVVQSTPVLSVTVANDLIKGYEGAPVAGGPTYYTATEVTDSFVSKTAADFDPDSGSVGSSRQLVDGVNNQTAMMAGDNTLEINGAARKASLRSQLFGTVTLTFSTPDGTSYDCDISSLGLSATPSAAWCQISQANSATPIAYSVERTSSTLVKLKFASAPSSNFTAHLLIIP